MAQQINVKKSKTIKIETKSNQETFYEAKITATTTKKSKTKAKPNQAAFYEVKVTNLGTSFARC